MSKLKLASKQGLIKEQDDILKLVNSTSNVSLAVMDLLKSSLRIKDQPFDFRFVRVFDNGTCIGSCSNPKIVESLYKKKTHIVAHPPAELIQDKFHHIVPEDGLCDSWVLSCRKDFGVTGIYNYIERSSGFFDVFCLLSSGKRDQNLSTFLNIAERMANFASLFRDKMSDQLDELEKNRILLPHEMLPNFKGSSHSISLIQSEVQAVLQRGINEGNARLKREKGVSLSLREQECLGFLLLGFTAKEIAEQLGLSPNTIEYYLENIKIKTNCSSKSSVRDYFLKVA